MAGTAFKSFCSFVVYNIELHSEALRSVDRNRLMIDNGQEVFVGSYGYNKPVKSDGFELISSEIE